MNGDEDDIPLGQLDEAYPPPSAEGGRYYVPKYDEEIQLEVALVDEDVPSAAGGGHRIYEEEKEISATIKQMRIAFAFLVSMHSAIDDIHPSNSNIKNIMYQMSSPLNKLGYLPPNEAFQAIVANLSGDKKTLDELKIDLRNLEKEAHRRDKYGTIIFKNIINPDNSIPHENPNVPEPFMYYVPHIFEDLLQTNTLKDVRIAEFDENLGIYKDLFIEWCPHWDATINANIERLFSEIDEFVETNKKNLPKKGAPPISESGLLEFFKNKINNNLEVFLNKFNEYNNDYVSGIFQDLRHKTMRGDNSVGLPRYILEGIHPGEDPQPYTGFSLVIYADTDLMNLWREYCGQTGINPDSAKEQDGAILRMDPPSPMYSFLRWCANFLNDEVDAKSSYIVFLKMLSVDYSTHLTSEYGYVTTDEILYFIHLLKKIISNYVAKDIDEQLVYIYMFGCGIFDADKEEELTEIFKNIEYVSTQTSQLSNPKIPTIEINTLSASQTGLRKVVEAFASGAMPNEDAEQNDTVLTLANAIITKNENPGFSQSVLSQETNGLQYNEGQIDALTQISQILSQSAAAATAGGGGRVFGGGGKRRKTRNRRNRKTRRGRKTR